MLDVVSITAARQNLSRLIDEVVRTQQPKVLIRESKPQAVVIPYEQYRRNEQNWRSEFTALMKKNQKAFKAYLKKQGISYPKSEKAIYAILNNLSGRY